MSRTDRRVREEEIDQIIEASEITTDKKFDCMTVVYCKLPNGFIITETSACIDPSYYQHDIGVSVCMRKIKAKIWELEGYRLMCELKCE